MCSLYRLVTEGKFHYRVDHDRHKELEHVYMEYNWHCVSDKEVEYIFQMMGTSQEKRKGERGKDYK